MPAASRASKATEAFAMTTTARRFTACLLRLVLFLGATLGAWAAPPPPPPRPPPHAPLGPTPPRAASTVDAPGYSRAAVRPERTAFITRRSGRATMTVAGGSAVAIAPSEEVVLDGATTPRVQSFVAPPLDVWDSWNYARTDELIDSMSARYVPAGGYGLGAPHPPRALRRGATYRAP